MRRFLSALALMSSLSGCLTVGRPFPVELVPSLELGKTTREQVRNVFSDPTRTGVDDGDETWTYMHYKLSAFGEQKTRDLYVRFNKDGTVKSYSFNSSYEEDSGLIRRANGER